MDSDSPIKDFLGEFGWYQRRGIAPNLTKKDLTKLWEDSAIVRLNPNEFDKYGNFSPYKNNLNGKIEDRIKKLMQIATTENREDVFDTKWQRKRKANPTEYFRNLAELVYSGKGYPPVTVVDVNGIRRFITGGRTRAAIGKALNVPVNTKIIKIKHIGPWSDRAKKIMKIK